jgi:hypothetical protein
MRLGWEGRSSIDALRLAADLAQFEIGPGSRADRCSLRRLEVREWAGATIVALDRGGEVRSSERSPTL